MENLFKQYGLLIVEILSGALVIALISMAFTTMTTGDNARAFDKIGQTVDAVETEYESPKIAEGQFKTVHEITYQQGRTLDWRAMVEQALDTNGRDITSYVSPDREQLELLETTGTPNIESGVPYELTLYLTYNGDQEESVVKVWITEVLSDNIAEFKTTYETSVKQGETVDWQSLIEVAKDDEGNDISSYVTPNSDQLEFIRTEGVPKKGYYPLKLTLNYKGDKEEATVYVKVTKN